VQIIIQIAEVLQHWHEKAKFIQHDISRGNIMLRKKSWFVWRNNPEIVIIDLAAGELLERPRRRKVVGKKDYLPPERLQEPPAPISPQIDIYGLGMVLYELLAGKLPNQSTADMRDTKRQLMPIREQNERVSSELNDLVMQTIERDPQKRQKNIPTMQHLLAQLKNVPEAQHPCWMHHIASTQSFQPTILKGIITLMFIVAILWISFTFDFCSTFPDFCEETPVPTQQATITPLLTATPDIGEITPTVPPTSTPAILSTPVLEETSRPSLDGSD
jgi:serine/threonine protein kinase